jgi:gas vesicle protein
MVNHDYEHEDDAHEPEGSWAGPLAGVLVGLLIGGLAGAMAMLFLAPQSGRKTRAKMHQLSHELRAQTTETVEDAAAQVRVKAGQITYDVREQAEGLGQRGQAVLEGKNGH